MKPRNQTLKCPCCGKDRPVSTTLAPLRFEALLNKRRPDAMWDDPEWTVRAAGQGWLKWACEDCARNGRALEARPWLQLFHTFPPRLAYYDKELVCRRCGQGFVFTMKEQKRWFEDLKIWAQAEPARCPRCRRAARSEAQNQKELVQALKDLDPASAASLARVADLYLSIGSRGKAIEYLRRAKNRAGSERELAELLERISVAEASESQRA